MPLYDIKCERCGYQTEAFVKLDRPLPDCEKCGSSAVIRDMTQNAPQWSMGKTVLTGQPFFSEREVEATYGKKWRETAKNPYRPGGDRHALYFDQK